MNAVATLVTVTITGHTGTHVYDGAEHTTTGYDFSSDNTLYTESCVSFNGTASASRTDEGTTYMGLTPSKFSNNSANFTNVTFTVVADGSQTITPITTPIVITAASDSKTYDGLALTNNGYTYTEGVLLTGDVLTATVEGTITHFGTAANTVTGWQVMRGTTDVTGNYTFGNPVAGTLSITKRTVTLTSATASKTYDGTALTNSNVTVGGDGFANGEGATYNVTGSQLNAGTSANTFTYTLNSGTQANDYNISTTNGTLTVNPVTAEVVVLIVGNSHSDVYDATTHTISGYEITAISNSHYTVDMISKPAQNSPSATASRTDVGTTVMTLSESQFLNISDNFTNVSFVVSPGAQTITHASVTVTADNKVKVLGEPDPILTATVTGLQGTDNVSVINYSLNREPGNVLGTYAITPTGAVEQGNYTVTYVPGTLTIIEPTKTVTIASGTHSWTYDGDEHSWPEYTVTCDGVTLTHIDGDATQFLMPTGDVLHITNAPSLTDAGSTVNTFAYNFTPTTSIYTYEVTPTYGNISVSKKSLNITGEFSKVYDGTPLVITYDQLNYNNGLVGDDALTAGTITTDGYGVGTYVCGDGNTWSFATLADGTATASGFAPASVTQNYAVSFNVTLKILSMTEGFSAPDDVVITLTEGTNDTLLTTDVIGTATLTPANAHTHVGNDMPTSPVGVGTYTVAWTLYDDFDYPMITRNQTVKVQYAPCEGTITMASGHEYTIKRIGSQCWFTENLREEVGDHHAYNDNVSNVDKFGYLYNWYTTVGVTEGNDNEAPTTFTADNGTPYVQGICPAGWSVGSAEDYHILDMYAGSVSLLKDPSTEYWFSGFQGVAGGTGFNARGGGWYKSSVGHYEDLMTGYHFWQSDATPGSNAVTNWSILYYCDTMVSETNVKSDRKSVRCIRKKVTH